MAGWAGKRKKTVSMLGKKKNIVRMLLEGSKTSACSGRVEKKKGGRRPFSKSNLRVVRTRACEKKKESAKSRKEGVCWAKGVMKKEWRRARETGLTRSGRKGAGGQQQDRGVG